MTRIGGFTGYRRLTALLLVAVLTLGVFAPFVDCAPDLGAESAKVNPDKSFTLSRWGGVSTASIAPIQISGVTVEVTEGVNSVEYDFILDKLPASNAFKLTVLTPGATWYYQGALTAEEVANGYGRPDNVIGSYAVYGPYSGGGFGVGKLFHVYRPKITDAKGVSTWGVLSYADGVLTTTVPWDWLSKASYPVRVDPTFGYDPAGHGVSTLSISTANRAYASDYASPAYTGVPAATKVSAYVLITLTTAHFKGCAWTASDGGAILATGSAVTGTGAAGWFDSTISWTGPAASTTYSLGIVSDGGASSVLYYDSVGGTFHIDTSNTYATPGVLNWDASYNYKFSVYLTYTDVGPVVDSAEVTDLDDSTNLYVALRYYEAVVVVSKGAGCIAISSVALKVTQGATLLFILRGDDLAGSPDWTVGAGSSNVALDSGSCSWVSGTGTATFSFKVKWPCPAVSGDTVYGSAVDTDATNSTWTSDGACSIVSRLVTIGPYSDNPNPYVGSNVTITGTLRYATTQGGNSPSSSAPPNSEITGVHIYDQFDVDWGSNTTSSGEYSVQFNTTGMSTTSMLYVFVDGASPYTDGLTDDGRYVSIYLRTYTSSTILDMAADLLGISSITDPINAAINDLSAWFTDSLATAVSIMVQMITFMFFISGSVLYWLSLFVTFFTQLTTNIGNILNGTSSVVTGLGDIWAMIGFESWAGFAVMVAFLAWFDSIPGRARRSGQNEISVAIGDIQVVIYIVHTVFDWAYTIFNFIWGIVSWFISTVWSAIP